jgi:hypothetical protein
MADGLESNKGFLQFVQQMDCMGHPIQISVGSRTRRPGVWQKLIAKCSHEQPMVVYHATYDVVYHQGSNKSFSERLFAVQLCKMGWSVAQKNNALVLVLTELRIKYLLQRYPDATVGFACIDGQPRYAEHHAQQIRELAALYGLSFVED